jgi:hypothetical protein
MWASSINMGKYGVPFTNAMGGTGMRQVLNGLRGGAKIGSTIAMKAEARLALSVG